MFINLSIRTFAFACLYRVLSTPHLSEAAINSFSSSRAQNTHLIGATQRAYSVPVVVIHKSLPQSPLYSLIPSLPSFPPTGKHFKTCCRFLLSAPEWDEPHATHLGQIFFCSTSGAFGPNATHKSFACRERVSRICVFVCFVQLDHCIALFTQTNTRSVHVYTHTVYVMSNLYKLDQIAEQLRMQFA